MTISDFHGSHIRHVGVAFELSGANLTPTEVTEKLAAEPTRWARRGDPRLGISGAQVGVWPEGWWCLDSRATSESRDINDHLGALLDVLLPRREAILRFVAAGCETYFDIVWKSTNLRSGTGPLIDARAIDGIASLKASVGLDIYQIDETDQDTDA